MEFLPQEEILKKFPAMNFSFFCCRRRVEAGAQPGVYSARSAEFQHCSSSPPGLCAVYLIKPFAKLWRKFLCRIYNIENITKKSIKLSNKDQKEKLWRLLRESITKYNGQHVKICFTLLLMSRGFTFSPHLSWEYPTV